jgi:hypothetical protein
MESTCMFSTFCSRSELKYLIDYFLNEGEKGYKEGHEHDEGKKGHHDKVLRKELLEFDFGDLNNLFTL